MQPISVTPKTSHNGLVHHFEGLAPKITFTMDVESLAQVLFGESVIKFSDYTQDAQKMRIDRLIELWKETIDVKYIELALWAIPYLSEPESYKAVINSIPKDCGETHDADFLKEAIAQWQAIAEPTSEKVASIRTLYSFNN